MMWDGQTLPTYSVITICLPKFLCGEGGGVAPKVSLGGIKNIYTDSIKDLAQ